MNGEIELQVDSGENEVVVADDDDAISGKSVNKRRRAKTFAHRCWVYIKDAWTGVMTGTGSKPN